MTPPTDTVVAPQASPEAGLSRLEVEARRKTYGPNEVAERREHPVLGFLKKFWGISAWMLELIIVLSAVRALPAAVN